MEFSTVGFKTKQADLRRKSPVILAVSTIISLVFTLSVLRMSLPEKASESSVSVPAPVIIQLTEIPKTKQTVQLPPPPRPFVPAGIPLEVDDEFIPDDVTIEDTKLDLAAVPSAPPAVYSPVAQTTAIENEIYEYYAVEEPPKRLTVVSPVYPEMAERAGIKGTVVMKVLVNTKGTVDSVEVMEGPKIFYDASIEAAKKTTFTPARHNDRSVACWIIMPFRFVFGDN